MNAYETLLADAQGRPFAAIVGWPVAHSRSPALHGFWLKQHKIDGHYGRLPVEPNRAALQELVAFLRRTPNARGCNLTLPHKVEIMPLLDRIHPDAQRIGAVNTVIKQADGTLEGRNSDGFGFLAALRYNAPHWRPETGPVVVLGAGGAARAVVATLVDAGVPELRLVNRTKSTAVDLGVAFTPDDGRQIVVDRWERRAQALDGVTLLVNTTSLGMTGQPPLDLDLAHLPHTAAVVRHRLHAPGNRPARRRPRARQSLRRRAGHAAAPGPPGLRGLVRGQGRCQRRTAAGSRCRPRSLAMEATLPEGFKPLFRSSPFLDHNGPFFYKTNDDGTFVVGLRIEPKHANGRGGAHGGLLMTMCDIALGYRTSRSQTPSPMLTTASVTTDFAGGANVGDWVEAHVDVHKVGGRLAFANCYLICNGERIVHASAVFARSGDRV